MEEKDCVPEEHRVTLIVRLPPPPGSKGVGVPVVKGLVGVPVPAGAVGV